MTTTLTAHQVSDMNSLIAKPTAQCHVVAMSYPGRGHVLSQSWPHQPHDEPLQDTSFEK